MDTKSTLLSVLRTTTSLTALALVLGGSPVLAENADCDDGERRNDNVQCTVDDPDVTRVKIETYGVDNNPENNSGQTGSYTLTVNTDLSTSGHDEGILLDQEGGSGDNASDAGASGDSITLNLNASMTLGFNDEGDDDTQRGVFLVSTGGKGENGESGTGNTQGGAGGSGGTVTINSASGATVFVESESEGGSVGVEGWSQGGDGNDQADRGQVGVDELGGSGGNGGAVTVDLGSNVILTSTGEETILGVVGISRGGGGGDDSGNGGGGGAINITTEAVTVEATISANDDFADNDDITDGGLGGVSGIFAYSFGEGGDRSGDDDQGGIGGAAGPVTVRNNGQISVLLDTTGPMDDLATSAGIFAQSKSGDGGDSSDNLINIFSPARGGTVAGAVTVHVVDSIVTGSSDPNKATDAAVKGVFASSQGGDGGAGHDKADGGAGANGGAVTVITYTDGAGSLDGIFTSGNGAEGIYAESLGGKGGTQDPDPSVISSSNNAGAGGDGKAVLVQLGAPEISGQAITNAGIITAGNGAHGVSAQSIGGEGGDADGAVTLIGASSGDGGAGGKGGVVTVQSNAAITTSGNRAAGILAQSLGSDGGGSGVDGANASGLFAVSGQGGPGSTGGSVSVNQSNNITTAGNAAAGITAMSVGGGGGDSAGIAGGIVAIGGQGGSGANASTVAIDFSGTSAVGVNGSSGRTVVGSPIITTRGDFSYGLIGQSIGGGGGDGGEAFAISAVVPAVGIGGDGGGAGNGSAVNLTVGDEGNTQPKIRTYGENAHAVVGHSIGGGGGTGGDVFSGAVSLTTFSLAGAADSAGNGGAVTFDAERAAIETTGGHANAIALRSIGGGGGSGGNASSLSASLFFGSALAIGGSGGNGGNGGAVTATLNNSNIDTGTDEAALVTDAHGILAQSIGGGGGAGGSSISRALVLQVPFDPPIPAVSMTFAVGGSGGQGGNGGTTTVDVEGGTSIDTVGDTSHGVFAQSIGGGGGIGGSGTAAGAIVQMPGSLVSASVKVAVGGSGGSGGTGGNVNATLDSDITTSGNFSNGLYLQSIGGGGGDASTGTAESLLFSGGLIDALIKIPQYLFPEDSNAIAAAANATDAAIDAAQQAGEIVDAADNVTAATSIIRLPREITFEAAIGGKGGNGGHGGDLNIDINNRSTITTHGIGAKGVLAQTVGGGGGASQGATVGLGFGDFSDDALVGRLLAQKFVIELGRVGAGAADGGNVVADLAAPIVTRGAGADGVLIQSIGGGGGVGGSIDGRSASESGTFNPLSNPTFSGDSLINTSVALGGRGGAAGNGGNFDGSSGAGVELAGSVSTSGDHARGIVLQSIGGGGGEGGAGSAQDTNRIVRHFLDLGGTGGAGGNGGAIKVNLEDAVIQTTGFGAHGVVLQTIGGGGGLGGSGAREACEQVSVGGGRRSALATNRSDADPDAYSSQTAACAELASSSADDSSDSGNQGTNGSGGTITANAANQVLSVATNGRHAHGFITQSIGGGGGIGASGATNLRGDAAGTATSRSTFLHVGGDAANSSDTVSGAGAAINLNSIFAITTNDAGSVGLVAQSIGGGGGIYDVDGIAKLALGSAGSSGVGGNLSITNKAGSRIATEEDGAHGLVAQSIGGGGGLVIGELASNALSGNDPITLRVGGTDQASSGGGAVSVTHDSSANIVTDADETARGLIAQSIGGGGGLFTSLNAGSEGPTVDTPLHVGGNSSGQGGAVTVDLLGGISTSGFGSDAIVAQSIGGGGGIGDLSRKPGSTSALDVTVGGSGGPNGNGSTVTISLEGTGGGSSISTIDRSSYAIFAQSIGGGGGLASDNSDISDGSLSVGATGGTGGNGGSVQISGVLANIITVDEDSHAIVAQSIGGGGGVGRTLGVAGSGVAISLGGNVSTNASANAVTVDIGSTQGVETRERGAIGIVAQSIGGGGGIAATGSSDTNVRITTGGSNVNNNAGTVTVTLNDSGTAGVTTTGAGSHGIVAQSIGGGGGIAGAPNLISNNMSGTINTSGLGTRSARGNGGTVTVTAERNIEVDGPNAYGIIAQSIGGGGGIFGINGGVAGRNTAGNGSASAVSVTLSQTGAIRANGGTSVGILAQSLGDNVGSQGAISVDIDGIITSTDYGVLLNGGTSDNRVTVGSTGTILAFNNKAIGAFNTGGSTLTVDNSGSISGNIEADQVLTAATEIAEVSPTEFTTLATPKTIAQSSGNIRIINRTGGVLTGATRYDGDITNAGRIEVTAQQPTVIAGDFIQSAEGETILAGAGSATTPALDIRGNAQLDGVLSVQDATPVKGAVRRALQVGGTLNGAYDKVQFGLLEYTQTIENGTLSLTADRTRFGTPDFKLSKQQSDIGRHLDAAFAASNTSNTNTATSALVARAATLTANTSTQEAQLTAFLTQLSPEAILAPAALAVSRSADQFDTLIGCNSGTHTTPDGNACMKLDISGERFTQDEKNGAAGFDADVFTVAAGAETKISDDLSVGFTLGYENANQTGTSGRSSVDSNTAVLGLSMTKRLDNLSLSLAGLGSYSWNDAKRNVTVAGDTKTAAANYNSWTLAARGRAAYTVDLESVQLTPSLDLDVIQSATEGFSEKTDGLAGLTVNDASEAVFRATPALTLSGRYALGSDMVLKPRLGVGVSFASEDSYRFDAALNAAAPSAGTFESAVAMAQTVGRVDAGVTLDISNSAALTLDYRGLFSDDTTGHGLSARYTLDF